MASIIKKLYDQRKITCAPYVSETHYETIMGSEAYGVSNNSSDVDIYSFTIPPKDIVFPHLRGEIEGFSTSGERFEQFQQHHVMYNEKEYDLNCFNIVKYFRLCRENNPNMIDSMWTPQRCVIHISKVGELVRANRKLFLSKQAFHKFRGYAFAQLNKAKNKKPTGKRVETIEKFGWDVKFGYHIVRLSDEAEQILQFGELNLERNKEMMKAIRAGLMSLEEVIEWFSMKEKHLENLYHSSSLPEYPDEEKLKNLLLNCLEEFYGTLDKMINRSDNKHESVIMEIKNLIYKAGF